MVQTLLYNCGFRYKVKTVSPSCKKMQRFGGGKTNTTIRNYSKGNLPLTTMRSENCFKFNLLEKVSERY